MLQDVPVCESHQSLFLWLPGPCSHLLSPPSLKPFTSFNTLKPTYVVFFLKNYLPQDKEFFEKYLSGLVGEVFGEELMDKTKPDFYMVNFLRDDVLDEEGSLVEEAPKVGTAGERGWGWVLLNDTQRLLMYPKTFFCIAL